MRRRPIVLAGLAAGVWYALKRRRSEQPSDATWPSAQPADTWPTTEQAHPATDPERLKAETKSNPDDQTLVDRVESEIFRDRQEVKGRVNINSEDGVVVLRGQLDSQEMIEDLVSAVRDVEGVRNVESLLHLPGTDAPASSS